MAKGINRVHLIGNVGQDIELRRTNNGMSVCNIRLAMTERVKSGDQWVDQTEWIDVVVFGHSAESCSKFLRKPKSHATHYLQVSPYRPKPSNKKRNSG